MLLPINLFCKCLSILQVSYMCLQEPFGCVNAVNASVPSRNAMATAILNPAHNWQLMVQDWQLAMWA